MTSEEQFVKWVRLYIFIISFLQLLNSAYYLLFDSSEDDFIQPDWVILINLLISIGGFIALNKAEISGYIWILKLRLIIDSILLLFILDLESSIIEILSVMFVFVLFILGPELYFLKILQTPDKFAS